jgi:basic amino acid/polyamine antiporter, APA family
MRPGSSAPQSPLPRRLGFWSAVGIVIGVTIGSGIFRTPATIASRVPDPSLMLAVWVIGGVISLCGALSVAELAAALPQTGGWYVFVRESWGRLAGFLFGWSELVLIRASASGAIATVFAEYLLRSLGSAVPASRDVQVVAATAIVVAGLVNIRGVRPGAWLTGISTIGKCGALLLLILAAFLLGGTAGATAAHFEATGSVNAGLFGLALVSVLWAYDGFADVSFNAGEVIDPQRTLPRAIVFGTIAIVAIYLLANSAYLYVHPVERVAQSPLIAADTMGAIFGRVGVAAVSVVVTISTMGGLVGTMLGPPRVFFAMADDGLFFQSIARVHPRYRTPHIAIGVAVALGVAFVLTRTFEQLADTFVLAIWPFYGLAIAGIYRLRATQPDLARPYRVPGYPIVPAIFLIGVVYLVANALVADPLWTGVTFGIVLAGVPVYYVAFGRHQDHKERL